MKVAVLMGGLSKESEISKRSGVAVSKALASKGHTVLEVHVQSFDDIYKLHNQNIDKAFIALHGAFGEDGTVQGMLEWLKIPYTGSGVFASALCFDKIATKKWLKPFDILTPDYAVYEKSQDMDEWIENFKLDYPVIVKPNTEGSTFGVTRVYDKSELAPALKMGLQYDETVLIESYIKGREITVSVLGEHSLPIVEVVPDSGFYDFEAKYTPGKTSYHVPADLDAELTQHIRELSEKITAALKCRGAVRVDYMLKDKEAYFLEINTIPGMTETSLLPKAALCENLNFADLCEKILNL